MEATGLSQRWTVTLPLVRKSLQHPKRETSCPDWLILNLSKSRSRVSTALSVDLCFYRCIHVSLKTRLLPFSVSLETVSRFIVDEIPKCSVDWQFWRSMACFNLSVARFVLPFEALPICTICHSSPSTVLILYSLFFRPSCFFWVLYRVH